MPNIRKYNSTEDLCYEADESDSDILMGSDFWVSGVGLLSIGIGGLIGNVLTLLVLVYESRESRNSFNK